jgi:hypothetical protein
VSAEGRRASREGSPARLESVKAAADFFARFGRGGAVNDAIVDNRRW